MAQRKTPSLKYAEYVSPDRDSSGQVWLARLQLFETVRCVHPRFLESLSTDVLPLYRRLAKGGYDLNLLWRSPSPYKALHRDNGLKIALSQWATEFNAEIDWLMDDALRTLRIWHVAPDEHASLKWNTVHGHRHALGMGDPFTFTCGGWETTLLLWATYRTSVRRRFEKALLNYEHQTREFAESQGLVRAQRKYSPRDIEWFVLWQLAGMSSKDIADRCSNGGEPVDDSTVLKGIKAAGKLVGWGPLRNPKRNRKIR